MDKNDFKLNLQDADTDIIMKHHLTDKWRECVKSRKLLDTKRRDHLATASSWMTLCWNLSVPGHVGHCQENEMQEHFRFNQDLNNAGQWSCKPC